MYGILNLIRKMYGRPAMRRVLEVIRKYPETRAVQTVKNKGAPPSWYETGEWGGRGGISESSRLAAAKGLAEGSSRYLDPHPGTFMNYVRHKVPNREMFKDVANYYRLNPEKRAVMDDWYRDTGGQGEWSKGFMDKFIQDAIVAMSKRNLGMRNLTDHEQYMLALARQRRTDAQKGAKILQFPKRD